MKTAGKSTKQHTRPQVAAPVTAPEDTFLESLRRLGCSWEEDWTFLKHVLDTSAHNMLIQTNIFNDSLDGDLACGVHRTLYWASERMESLLRGLVGRLGGPMRTRRATAKPPFSKKSGHDELMALLKPIDFDDDWENIHGIMLRTAENLMSVTDGFGLDLPHNLASGTYGTLLWCVENTERLLRGVIKATKREPKVQRTLTGQAVR